MCFAVGEQIRSLQQLKEGGVLGGKDLCGEKELTIVHALAGHPLAFESPRDANCSLDDITAKLSAHCVGQIRSQDVSYCELDFWNFPWIKPAERLCRAPPSDEVEVHLFYDCTWRKLLLVVKVAVMKYESCYLSSVVLTNSLPVRLCLVHVFQLPEA